MNNENQNRKLVYFNFQKKIESHKETDIYDIYMLIKFSYERGRAILLLKETEKET